MNVFTKFSTKHIVVLSLILFLNLAVTAQTIKGKVTDSSTGEPLIGATITLSGTTEKTLVRLDGSYVFKNVKPGTYQIGIDFLGYKFYHTHILLRKSIKQRLCRKAACLRKAKITGNDYTRSISAWHGWAKHCNAHNLMKKLSA